MADTQAQKSARMRERLLDAALGCLVEYGYAGTTTTKIVERAEVSRGAMLHHFPSRIDLMVAAIEHIAEKRLAEFRSDVASLPEGEQRLSQAFDLVWQHFSSPSFYAMLELGVAARTEPELLSRLVEAGNRFEATLTRTTDELFGSYVSDPKMLMLGQVFIYYLMQGMATANMLRDESANIAGVMAMLKQLAKTMPAN